MIKKNITIENTEYQKYLFTILCVLPSEGHPEVCGLIFTGDN